MMGVLLAAAGAACAPSSPDAGARSDAPVKSNAPAPAPVAAGMPSAVGQRTPGGSRRFTAVFMGTSLTAGYGLDPTEAYPAQIADRLRAAGAPVDVVNAGLSGETSSGALRRAEWILRGPMDVFVLETGANDGLRGLPVAEAEANIRGIIAKARSAHPSAGIYLVQMEAPRNMGNAYYDAFHAMYPRVAAEERVTLLPFLLDGVAGEARLNQADGVHPNSEGEKRVTENVWRALGPALTALGAP